MLALFLALTIAISPNDEYQVALADLTGQVTPESRLTTRYASLKAVPLERRQDFLTAFIFALNSTSTSSQFFRPVVIGDLVRIDLSALNWDRDFRTEELRRLEEEGVPFSFKDPVLKNRFIDIWEDFGAADTYYRVTQGQRRGWIDPGNDIAARAFSGSQKFLLRADWLLTRILVEAKDSGYYSQLLLLPTNEANLYKRFGQNIKTIERFNQLRHGGAVIGPSIVALHNRELQEIPSSFGYDFKFIWRTFDFAKDADDPTKNVFRSLAGTAIHDGREIIGTLPNGLHWYYLSDGKGAQANVVPQNVALDQRSKRGISDPNVTNAIKCMDCHTPVSGIYPFQDRVKGAVISPEIALAVIAKEKEIRTEFVPVIGPPPSQPRLQIQYASPMNDAIRAQVLNRVKDLEEYYLTNLTDRVVQQQDSYGRRLLICNGLAPAETASNLVDAFNTYKINLVDPTQAAREMGLSLDDAVPLLRASGNQDLILLSNGMSIRRAVWEAAYPDVARVPVFPWELLLRPTPAKY